MTKYNLCIYHIIYNISSDTERVFLVFKSLKNIKYSLVTPTPNTPHPIIMPSYEMLFLPGPPPVGRVSVVLLTGDVLSGDDIEEAGPGTGDGGLATSSSRQLSLQ